ncbi:tetratricopeptide repeat protein [Neisseria mucosa]|uniref:Tetratricopeptide repeat protein n=1 Tax=Neisseria mucosa TaxID=488 RepID=A0AAW6ZKB8_NEIMU|nr:tetratricopeptide repeat protein [Neisseria mucosa]MDK6726667.1 tetratricopeptide repeat protein [Neisseria mucosa]MDK6871511.1 tetratricopeptide repeat protein [Neisseria mucosa]MDK8110722.1 tetratricopeptide repeat protein [Neisseria mucosa]MDK8362513.1 tetratricopeptide repeat protein [Neisseria mucosa]
MMDVNGLISEASQLFNEGKYAEVIEKLEQANKITHKITQTEERINIQSGLGRCHLELAMKSKNKYEADKLFGNAVKHYQECLRLAKIYGKNSVQQQNDAQFWLGRCYFEHAKKTKDTDKAGKLFELAVEHYQEWLQLAKQLKDKQSSVQLAKQLTDEQGSVQQQINAQSWLGHCYFEHAKKTKDTDKAGKLFEQAATSFEQQLQLSEQLENDIWQKKEPIWKLNTRYLLGRCFFEQARISKDKTESFIKSVNFFNELREEILNINKKEEKKKKNLPLLYSNEKEKEGLELEKKIHHYLRDIDYLNEDWISYFEKKKQEIQESLFKSKTSQPQDAVSTILAVLYITPMELGSIPMAHYTSPHVCHILFGIGGKETASPMRLGSSTYMNDPSEGRGLLDLLNQQDLELENKADGTSHNAFFTCFSSRVNDLNQFRLYGKEGGVEASGCCLVFNKNGDWLKESDISIPFRGLSEMSGQSSDDLPIADFSGDEYEKLPLYQVAYIAYKDEYIEDKKCGIWFPSQAEPKFGIRLKPVGNEDWHQFRLGKLKEALEELIRFFNTSTVSDDDKEALEYIRYLFKDFAFRDEEEFRLLVIKPIDSEEIEYCETTQSVYIPYTDIRNRADEVILGTNYEKTGNQRKAEVFRYRMKQKCPDVKVSRSTLPINPPNK